MAEYYGWSLSEIEAMDIQSLEYADLAIRQLDAQKRIIEAKIAMIPNMKKADLEKFMKALHQEAYPHLKRSKRITEKQLKEMLGNVGR